MTKKRLPAKAFRFYLHKALDAKGLSKRKLARLADMPYPQIIRLSKADANPTWETVVRLAEAMEVEPSEFYFRRWQPPPAPLVT